MDKKRYEVEYYLGYNKNLDGYKIVEYHTDWSKSEGCCCFWINDFLISDGDGFPTSYDDAYVKIEEKDFRYVNVLFNKVGEEMCALAEKSGQPITRPIAPGDYIHDGSDFMHIQNISADREKLWVERFYHNTYDLNLDTDLDVVSKDDEFDLNEIESVGLLITEEIYHQALNIAKSAILEISDYLDMLYKDGIGNNRL